MAKSILFICAAIFLLASCEKDPDEVTVSSIDSNGDFVTIGDLDITYREPMFLYADGSPTLGSDFGEVDFDEIPYPTSPQKGPDTEWRVITVSDVIDMFTYLGAEIDWETTSMEENNTKLERRIGTVSGDITGDLIELGIVPEDPDISGKPLRDMRIWCSDSQMAYVKIPRQDDENIVIVHHVGYMPSVPASQANMLYVRDK